MTESIDFSTEDLKETETKKQRLERYYNEMAVEAWYSDIEEFYVKQKFKLAMKTNYTKWNDYLSNLLKTIASDMWYGWNSKEFVMQNTIPTLSNSEAIMR